jgi:cyclin E
VYSKIKITDTELGARFRFRNYFKHTPSFRYCPLPKFSWANSEEVWKLMTEKEDFYTRNPHALDGHPTLEPRMCNLQSWV